VALGADVPVVLTDNGPQLVMGNGDRFPAIDMFAHALRGEVAQAFDLYPSGHRPRVVVDRLTIARERWSLPVSELVFADAPDEAARFLACRRFAGHRALPRYLFVKSPLETKPFFVDLASPVYVELLVSAVRKLRSGQPDARLSVTEMLPSIDQTWLPDASGNRYVAEFRLVAYDTRATAEGESDGIERWESAG
jgi:hypothetical protein